MNFSSFTNDGNITVSSTTGDNQYGIAIDGSMINEATLTNSGTIDVNSTNDSARGISIGSMTDSAFLNDEDGQILVSGADYARGFDINSITNSSVINEGTFDISSEGEAIGFRFDGIFETSTFTNSGDIIVDSSGADAYGVAFNEDVSNSRIENTNTGTITVTASSDKAYGIFFNGDEVSDTNITNSGQITVTSELSSARGISLNPTPLIASSLINDGTITVTAGTTAYGMEVTELNENSSFINNGTLSVSGTTGAYGMGIWYSSDGTGIVENNGDINVSTTNNNAAGIWAEKVSSILNTGTIVSTATPESAAYGLFALDVASITNDGNITAIGASAPNSIAIFTSIGSGTITNTGTINGNLSIGSTGLVTNSGTINLYGSAGSIIAGDYLQTSSGVLGIDLGIFMGEAGISKYYSQLAVTETATLADDTTLRVDVSGTNELQTALLDANTTLNNVITAGTLVVDVSKLNVEDNSALLNFEAVLDGNTLDLNVVEASTILDSTIAGGGQTPARAAAAALDLINDGDYTGMSPVITALNALATDEQVASAVASLTPDVANASIGVASQIANGIQGIVEQRQNVGFAGLNSGDKIFSDQYIWMKTYGNFGEQNDKDGINGFDVNAYGIGVGIDGEYALNQKAGLAFFYTNASVDTNNVNQEADVNVYTLLTYGSIPVIDDKTKLLYQLGYSLQKTDTTRTLFDATVATADFTSQTASLDVKLLRNYNVYTNWLVQPIIQATYRHYKTPSYTESGSSANLSVNESTSEELIAGLGVVSHYKLDEKSKIISNVQVGYDLIDDALVTTSSFANAAGVEFSSNGIDNGRWSYSAGLGYEINLNQDSNLNFTLNYQGEGSDYHSTSFSAKYLMKF